MNNEAEVKTPTEDVAMQIASELEIPNKSKEDELRSTIQDYLTGGERAKSKWLAAINIAVAVDGEEGLSGEQKEEE